jgi:hypothetical protein
VDPAGRLRLTSPRRGHPHGMRLKRTLAAVAIAGTTMLTGCAGTNTNLERGETDCDAGQNSHDQNCTESGTPTPADNT